MLVVDPTKTHRFRTAGGYLASLSPVLRTPADAPGILYQAAATYKPCSRGYRVATAETFPWFDLQNLADFMPVSASARVLYTVPSPTTVVSVVAGFVSVIVHFLVFASLNDKKRVGKRRDRNCSERYGSNNRFHIHFGWLLLSQPVMGVRQQLQQSPLVSETRLNQPARAALSHRRKREALDVGCTAGGNDFGDADGSRVSLPSGHRQV